MSITSQNILKHELIGLWVEIVDASNKKNIGINGKIIDETQKTLVIRSKGKQKRVFKTQTTLRISLPNKQKVEVDGKLLNRRPWERIKRG